MASEIVCPNCGGEGSISWKFDAWARFGITGVDARGELMRSAEFNTQVFDHNEIECSACGRLFNEMEIMELLRRTGLRAEE
jgi:DNA-directed RNA polymerase subunit RPC12/RpoP